MSEPTEAQEEFFDSVVDRLEDLWRLSEATIRCLQEGEFDTAVSMMDEGCLLTDGSVWETLTKRVEELRAISNQLESEDN